MWLVGIITCSLWLNPPCHSTLLPKLLLMSTMIKSPVPIKLTRFSSFAITMPDSLPTIVPCHSYTIISDARSSPTVHQINDVCGNTVCLVKRGRVRRRHTRRAMTPNGGILCWSLYTPKEGKGFARFIRNDAKKSKKYHTLNQVPMLSSAQTSPGVSTTLEQAKSFPWSMSTPSTTAMSRVGSRESESYPVYDQITSTITQPSSSPSPFGPVEVLITISDTDEKLAHFHWRAAEYAWRWSPATRRLDCLCTRANPETPWEISSSGRMLNQQDATSFVIATMSVPVAVEWLSTTLVFPHGRCEDPDLEQMLLLSCTRILERMIHRDAAENSAGRRRKWLKHRRTKTRASLDSGSERS
jgi:hypothetical protein